MALIETINKTKNMIVQALSVHGIRLQNSGAPGINFSNCSNILNFTFKNVKILKCKNILIDFLNELGNFKQNNFYTSKCKFFLHLTTTDQYTKVILVRFGKL